MTINNPRQVERIILGRETKDGTVTRPKTEPIFIDLHFPAGTSFEQVLPAGHTARVYVYKGSLDISGTSVPTKSMALLDQGDAADGIRLIAGDPTRALLVAGRPLRQPIVQHGPFVMNKVQEIHEAFEDFQAGRFA